MIKRIINSIAFRYHKYIAPFKYSYLRCFYPFPHIMTIDETVKILLCSNKSIARYGDGELNMIHNYNLGFQNYNEHLAARLKDVLISNNDNCLIALPGPLASLEGQVPGAKKIWKKLISQYYLKYYKNFDFNRKYPNSFISRPYMDFIDKLHVENHFCELKKIWDGKRILIVEGQNSKLGVGNDLFEGVERCRRIITLNKNAFSLYDKILKNIIKYHQEDDLVILALGPTATVLAYDLSQLNIRALDLGHIDIEYEWYKKGAESKIKIEGKDVNELNSFNSNTDELDMSIIYTKQIITKILN